MSNRYYHTSRTVVLPRAMVAESKKKQKRTDDATTGTVKAARTAEKKPEPPAAAASDEAVIKAAKKKAKKAALAAGASEADAKAAGKAAAKAAKKADAKTVAAPVPVAAAVEGSGDDDEAAYRAKLQITAGDLGDASTLPPCNRSFESAPFVPKVIAALSSSFDAPTPIQAQSWPILAEGGDLIAVAKTGSGKTLGFLLPMLHALAKGGQGAAASDGGVPAVRGLVLAPTRELARQIRTLPLPARLPLPLILPLPSSYP
jgi:ATP-dependent RNA helicase DBP3